MTEYVSSTNSAQMNIRERDAKSFIQSIATSPAGICKSINTYGWLSVIEHINMLIVCDRNAVRFVVNAESSIGDIAYGKIATYPACSLIIALTSTGKIVTSSIAKIKQLLLLDTSLA